MIQAAILGSMLDCSLQSTYFSFPKRANSPHSWCDERYNGSKHLAFVRVQGSDCDIVCLEVPLAWPIRPSCGSILQLAEYRPQDT